MITFLSTSLNIFNVENKIISIFFLVSILLVLRITSHMKISLKDVKTRQIYNNEE